MCGIAGYIGNDGDTEKLKSMAKALKKRGPDDEGFYEENNNTKVGFAFRRLSIIDVAGGHQPIGNEDDSIQVMLNGEIYSFQNLKKELLQAGHKFKTSSDTETIVHAYEEWGEKCFEKLNGMFAIAIWDSKKEQLILARDRMGKKPLYYGIQNNTLWFASELKSILATNIFKKEIDIDAVALFFRTDYIPTPKTIFKNIFKLEPATYLIYKDGKINKTKFWNFPEPARNATAPARHDGMAGGSEAGRQDVLDGLREKIDKAVEERLVSDVPLGLFLSGGLDSAIVAESASRQNAGLQSFTLGFEDKSYDETDKASAIAKQLGLKHYIEILKEKDALLMIEEATDLLDEPLADPSILPQLLLSKFTRQNVTVALSGDGGDELLLGYQHVSAHIWRERLNFLPETVWNTSSKILKNIPSGNGYFSAGFKAQRLSRGLNIEDRLERDLSWRGSFTKEDIKDLFLPEISSRLNLDEAENIMENYAKEALDPSSWSAWSFAYLRTFLMDDVMVKVDRATMWYSLEARAPLLDKEVVSFLLNVPDTYKLGAWKNKRLFKELLKDKLPEDVLNMPKHGFGVPTSKWLNGPLKEKLLYFSDSKFLKDQNVFQKETIDKMIAEHGSGKKDRRKELWSFLSFQMWYDKWINVK